MKCNRCGEPKTKRRAGDWVCRNCDNLNFSFRRVCNRCSKAK